MSILTVLQPWLLFMSPSFNSHPNFIFFRKAHHVDQFQQQIPAALSPGSGLALAVEYNVLQPHEGELGLALCLGGSRVSSVFLNTRL